MRADAGRIAQALANILNNAVDAAGDGGHVAVSVRAETDEVVFEVLDDGPGLHLGPDEDVFSPFFTRKEGGTGLGLSVVHRIVTAHGGRVTHGDRAEGGARFEIRLPLDVGPKR